MTENLSQTELKHLIGSVFSLREEDKNLAILVDVPDQIIPDNPEWRRRRELASDWHWKLNQAKNELGLERVDLIFYPNVHSNNADLPAKAFFYDGDVSSLDGSTLSALGQPFEFESQLARYQIILAPTEFSTTAPLKLLAKKYHFRAATMPGFSAAMIPALKLDYREINRRVDQIKQYLDKSIGVTMDFALRTGEQYQVYFDLRYRTAHASAGRFPEPGVAGNLPSGEAYIVPYEGEKGEPSLSHGILPVQFGDEIVLYRIEENIACEVISTGAASSVEAQKIKAEPAYGNIAEIGFGVLGDFGVKPIGEILLDEKLGLHIAFGRSDHFGGAVGVKSFTAPDKVIHIDRIYIPEIQPEIVPAKVQLQFDDSSALVIIAQSEYQIWT
ncbi:MAG: hypothetical protein ONB13_00965 [candidate division KSB1 bacterium]|nr:hypothetical protein [candidate division KSB1 bacterium]MDZ7358525.1 hypothetical protein [candidate division KSB1 bacterium]MDZ7375163.1 hypothetical protein [candidate division KSB1 bacterium]MDZ7399182.1 hypothetical protein [candidate division KSB1 bacterium]